MWNQLRTATSFYSYGKKHFRRSGYDHAQGRPEISARFCLTDRADLSGRVFVVTGANSGCGKEICRYLVQHRADAEMGSPQTQHMAELAFEMQTVRLVTPYLPSVVDT